MGTFDVRRFLRRLLTVGPAVAMTLVSMALTLAVVVLWLGQDMPRSVALVVGVGLDGGWLATLAYERRLAAQGDHSLVVTLVGWAFGLIATGVLVTHALLSSAPGPWLAVSWLPLAAKGLWLVHGQWERTSLTPAAMAVIREIQQESRDDAAVARARLRAEAGAEETRLTSVTQAGARVARAQSRTATELSKAWSKLEAARQGDGTARALTCVTERVTPESQPWALPVWGDWESSVPAIEAAPALSDGDLDRIVAELRDSETPPLTYRELAARFRAAGHSAGETRLRAAWRRVTAIAEGA